ncbi:hypothetical protein CDL15_Pgr024657 [Punica granatum]|uniref:Uncharacterized protein n=1 Tax=Punica granatum TaxID=22663 RepID=A0A218WVC6_PUNGR|nr:hypothetical protein CDL15_Pgr024657 [Punica granatum]
MHIRGARCTRSAAGVNGRRAGRAGAQASSRGVRAFAGVRAGGVWRAACARAGVWRAGVRAGRRLARGCERGRAAERAATGVLFTREHVLHPESPK